jgi:hypothetical protein
LKRLRLLLTCLLGLAGSTTFAGDLAHVDRLSQADFLKLSEDLGAVAAYKGVTPATPLGITGFDVGIEIAASKLQNSAVFQAAGGGSSSTLYVPKLHLHKGLPGGLDIGVFASRVSGVNISLWGLEARYAVLDDGLTTPALALRISGTRQTGASQIDLSTYAFDAMLSKQLTFVTPFAGVGAVRVNSNTNVNGLSKETFNKGRAFVGLNVNLALINFALEAEKMGDVNTLSAKAGWRF